MRRIAVIVLLTAIVLIFGVGQLVLPGIAASVLRSRLSADGRVVSVEVSAFPAIELLWEHADHVAVRLATYRSGQRRVGQLLDELGGVGAFHASIGTFSSGLLTLHDVVLQKRGDELHGSARLLQRDLHAAVPFLQSVQLLRSSGGTITLRGTVGALGLSASADATIAPRGGKLVVVPDLPFGSLATVTVFSQPSLFVQAVEARAVGDGLAVSAEAALR